MYCGFEVYSRVTAEILSYVVYFNGDIKKVGYMINMVSSNDIPITVCLATLNIWT